MAYNQMGWATNDLDPDGNPTKVVPPPEVMATGILKGEPMGRQWLNYLFNWCISNIDPGRIPAAQSTHAVRIFTRAQPDMVANGWRLIKTEVLTTPVSVTMYYYEHVGV